MTKNKPNIILHCNCRIEACKFYTHSLTCQPLPTLHFATSQPAKWSPSQVRSLQVPKYLTMQLHPNISRTRSSFLPRLRSTSEDQWRQEFETAGCMGFRSSLLHKQINSCVQSSQISPLSNFHDPCTRGPSKSPPDVRVSQEKVEAGPLRVPPARLGSWLLQNTSDRSPQKSWGAL
jgi:hypothetical protein